MVDNFAESNRYCICSLFPIILGECLFKILEVSVKTQLVDFRVFYGFLCDFKKVRNVYKQFSSFVYFINWCYVGLNQIER